MPTTIRTILSVFPMFGSMTRSLGDAIRGYYVVYALSELEDLSNQEIADRLSLSLGTVKIRLHRARALLYGELRRDCRCYRNERGELMGEPNGRPPRTLRPAAP